MINDMFYFGILVLLAVLIVAFIWRYPGAKKATTIPGLNPSNKENGNLGDIQHAGSLHSFLVDLHKRFGPIARFWWGKLYVVSIASPELFKQNAKAFDRPPDLYKMFEPVWDQASLTYANGEDGRTRRKHYDRPLALKHLQVHYGTMQKAADALEKKWLLLGEHDQIPVSEHMNVYAIDLGLLCMLGDHFHDEKHVLGFKQAYDLAWSEMEHRLTDPNIPDEDSPRNKKFKEALSYLRSTVREVVEKRKQFNLHKQGNLLIDVIIETAPYDDVIFSDTITYLIGGFHTTGNLLTWALYYLARHKDVQTKLHEEIVQVLGDKGHVMESNFRDLKYLRQVIDETLRCAIIAPYASRVQDFDTELGGHKIPKNTPVIHALGVVLKDESLWPLPNKFDPDRFTDEQIKKQSSNVFAPFGFAGKRKCPGVHLSYLESSVLLATLIRRFEIHRCDDQEAVQVHGLVTHPRDEVWITITKRN